MLPEILHTEPGRPVPKSFEQALVFGPLEAIGFQNEPSYDEILT